MDRSTLALIASSTAEPCANERKFYAEKTLRTLYKGSLAFEPVLLKSNLFRPGSGSRAMYTTYTDLKAYGSTRIEYKGEELRQDDLRVLLALVKIRAGSVIGNVIEFVPRTFAREVLSWPDSGESVKKLKACVLRLHDARARIHFKEGLVAMSFVSDAVLANEGGWQLWLSELLLPVFERNLTFLKADERLAMKDGMASWLYGFIKADSCMLDFDLHEMRAAAGSTYGQKDFNKQVKKTLEAFTSDGIVKDFRIAAGKLTVRKSA